MEPEIVKRSEIKVIGSARQYSEEDLDLDLDTLWSAFRENIGQITNRVGSDAFGIYEEYQESENTVGFSYICSIEVSDFDRVPDGMLARTIPAHLYAVFRHDGPISSLPETMKYIWGSWLPKSDYEYVEKPDFELFSPEAQPKGADKALFLHIPVSPKSQRD